MKYFLLYTMLLFVGVEQCRAQAFGQIAVGNGTIRENRNLNVADSSFMNRYAIDRPVYIYPNPATDYVWIVIASEHSTVYGATVFDINGTVLLHRDWLTEPGTHKYYFSLPAGSFDFPLYIRVNGPWNVGVRIFRILKQF